jgi:hypothetical protein
VTDQSSDLLPAAWRRFEGLHDDLLELALSAGNLDEGATAALLGRMVGHIQFMGLQLRSDPARPTLINTGNGPHEARTLRVRGHTMPAALPHISRLRSIVGEDRDTRVRKARWS